MGGLLLQLYQQQYLLETALVDAMCHGCSPRTWEFDYRGVTKVRVLGLETPQLILTELGGS